MVNLGNSGSNLIFGFICGVLFSALVTFNSIERRDFDFAYGFRYAVKDSTCAFIKNSTDLGYYYGTPEKAESAGLAAIRDDSLLSYQYLWGPEVFHTIKPKE